MSDKAGGGVRRYAHVERATEWIEPHELTRQGSGSASRRSEGAFHWRLGDSAEGTEDPRDNSDALDYAAFFRKLWRRKWLFMILAVLTTSVATAIIVRLPSHYSGHALVVIDDQSLPNLSGQTTTIPTGPPDVGTVQTAVEVLRSPQLAAEVSGRLKLGENPEFNPALAELDRTSMMARVAYSISRIKEWCCGGPVSSGPQPDTTAALSQTVTTFLAHLNVSIKDNSRMIDVAFESTDPHLAMLVANTLVDDYIDKQLKLRTQSARQTSDWLRDRISQAQAKVEGAERAVEEYRSQNGLFSMPGGSPLLLKQMTDVSAELANAQTTRAAIEARLGQYRASLQTAARDRTAVDLVDSPLMTTLHAQEADAQQQLAETSTKLSDEHPIVVGLKERLRYLRAAMRSESLRVIASLDNDLRIARMKEQDLSQRLGSLQGDVSRMNGADVTLRALEREAQADRLLLDNFTASFQATSQMTDAASLRPEAQIVSYAQLPVSPERPKKGLLILIAGIASLIGAVFIVHLAEKSDRSFHSLEEVEGYLKIAGLGMLPMSDAARISAPEAARYGSAYREALKAIYLNLLGTREMPQVTVVTSALPGEGKTTLALSLAAMAAQGGQRVILVDADFWKAGAGTALGFRSGVGLAEVLEGRTGLANATISDIVSGTDIILPGKFSRGSLLAWIGDFRELLDSLRRQYDVVIVDAPPVLSAAESVLLSKDADATVMAVRWGETPRDAAAMALRKLHYAGAFLAGSVMTMVKERQHARYGYTEATYFSSQFEAYQSSPTSALTRSSMPRDSQERRSDDEQSHRCPAKAQALLVIDVQENLAASSGWYSLPKATRDLLIETINGVSDLAASAGMTVVYAHEKADRSTATTWSHRPTKEMSSDNALMVRPDSRLKRVSELCFLKRAPDAFSNSKLNKFLREKSIDHLFVIGIDGVTSIKETVQSALEGGYRVTFIRDGIFTTSENKWKRLLKWFESAGAFAITGEEFDDFCQRLRKRAAPDRIAAEL